MFKTFFIILLFANFLNAELIEEIELSKDELKIINLSVNNIQKTLSFRWTLYKDRGLVMHIKYDDLPHQVVLYKNNLNSYKVVLEKIAKNDVNDNPNIILYFIDFNLKTNKAKFRYYLFNYNSTIEVI